MACLQACSCKLSFSTADYAQHSLYMCSSPSITCPMFISSSFWVPPIFNRIFFLLLLGILCVLSFLFLLYSLTIFIYLIHCLHRIVWFFFSIYRFRLFCNELGTSSFNFPINMGPINHPGDNVRQIVFFSIL